MLDSEFLSLDVLAKLWGPPSVATAARNWQGHVPFARWLALQDRPRTFVELGVFRGDSYLAFCDAVDRFGTGTKCFGVDTWAGDVHAGKIADEVFPSLSAFHDPRYGSFSKLLRMRFEDGVEQFENGSVDLLHVDGLHTYNAVRADYETWLPKMSSRGVMLFHDTRVFEREFGVHKLWAEVSSKYPNHEFEHSHGLGLIAIGTGVSPAVRWLTSLSTEEKSFVNATFARLAADAAAHVDLRPEGGQDYWFDESAGDYAELHRRALAAPLHALLQENRFLKNEIDSLKSSTSWRITAPIRKLRDALRRR